MAINGINIWAASEIEKLFNTQIILSAKVTSIRDSIAINRIDNLVTNISDWGEALGLNIFLYISLEKIPAVVEMNAAAVDWRTANALMTKIENNHGYFQF